jgi:hypothetical protein
MSPLHFPSFVIFRGAPPSHDEHNSAATAAGARIFPGTSGLDCSSSRIRPQQSLIDLTSQRPGSRCWAMGVGRTSMPLSASAMQTRKRKIACGSQAAQSLQHQISEHDRRTNQFVNAPANWRSCSQASIDAVAV